jgi:hypothetical protein
MNPDDIERELERLAAADATSGRAAIAKATALRTLLRLRRPLTEADEQVARLFDETRDPNEPVREDDWFPSREKWGDLFLHQTVGERRQFYLRLRGGVKS